MFSPIVVENRKLSWNTIETARRSASGSACRRSIAADPHGAGVRVGQPNEQLRERATCPRRSRPRSRRIPAGSIRRRHAVQDPRAVEAVVQVLGIQPEGPSGNGCGSTAGQDGDGLAEDLLDASRTPPPLAGAPPGSSR